MPDVSTFAHTIKLWRDRQGWTQKRLADELSIGETTVRRWESGAGLPQGTLREKLITLTGMSAQELGFLHTRGEGREEIGQESQVLTEVPASERGAVLPPAPVHRKKSTFHEMLRIQRTRVKHTAFLVVGVLVFLVIFLTVGVSLYFGNLHNQPLVVGQVAFTSSHQTRDDSNQGINDGVTIYVLDIAPPEKGKAYYGWLEPANPENPSLQLGELTLRNGAGSLLYQRSDDTNLLNFAAHIVITEQESTSAQLGPSLLEQNQKYVATIPNVHPPITSDPYSQEYSKYGLLDHFRHLLSSDPSLIARGVRGGLVPLLNSQADDVMSWAKNARDVWESNGDLTQLHAQAIHILDVLDGTTIRETPPIPGVGDRYVSSFALLPQPGQRAQESTIAHVDLHLRGVRASPGANEQMRTLAANLLEKLAGITVDLNAVRASAEKLYAMSLPQLKSEQAFHLLNELVYASSTAYAGASGVFALSLSAETFPTIDLLNCTPSLCQN